MRTNQNHFLFMLLFLLFAYNSFGQVTAAWTKHYRSQWISHDAGREIKTDALGNVYVGGQSSSADQVQQNIYTTIIKYDSNGNLLWQYHSPAILHHIYYINDMEIDASGNAYYAGFYMDEITSEINYLAVKIDSAGNELWTQQYDGNGTGLGWDYGWALTVDSFQNVYVTGYSDGITFNGYDWVTVKYNSSGIQQWVARWVNPDNATQVSNYSNEAFEVLTDNSGNVYVSGYAFNGTSRELTLLKYNSAGSFLWAQDFNTNTQWQTRIKNFMKMDAADNIYLLGHIQNLLTGYDILLLKYDGQGNLIWSRTWNSPANDSDYVCGDFYVDEGLAIDSSGNLFVSGVSTDPSAQLTDMVTLKYDSAGNFQWQNIFNGLANDQDIAHGIDADNAGNAYICGSTYASAVNDKDYVAFKINGTTGATEWTELYNGPVNLSEEAYAIHVDNQQNVYVTGESFLNSFSFDPVVEIVTIKYSPFSIGIDDGVSDGNSVIVFPNPATNQFTIYDVRRAILSLTMYNLLGEKVFSHPFTNNPKRVTIDASIFSAGIYFLKINFSNEDVALKKIVVK